MGREANGMQVRESFEILFAITIRFLLGEIRFRKTNVLSSQWHPFPSLF